MSTHLAGAQPSQARHIRQVIGNRLTPRWKLDCNQTGSPAASSQVVRPNN